MTSLAERAVQDAKSDMAKRGGWFKFKEGKNKIRILSEPAVLYEDFKLGICYTDCGFKGAMKYLAYAWDYADESIKLFKMPLTIFNYIANLELEEGWAFTGFPMPYDLVINAKDAGTKEVEYTPTPSPTRVEVPVVVQEEMRKKKSALEIIDGLKIKNQEKHRADGTWDALHQGGFEKPTPESIGADKKKWGEHEPIKYPDEEVNPEDIPF